VDSPRFKNLYEFFNYIEFCPLCKSRTAINITYQNTSCEFSNKELIFHDNETDNKRFTIDLLDNTISRDYYSLIYDTKPKIIIGRQCNKYHFFYNGIADISEIKLKVKNIRLDKYHFIRIHGLTHFTVNGSFIKSSTNIRITTPNFITRELTLPFVDFDLSSKKKIDAKLKNIQLLG